MKVVKTKVGFEGVYKDEYAFVEGEMLPAWSKQSALSVVGKPVARLEAKQKVTGTAKYTHDVYLPGMLYGRFLRSPYAHAKVKRIDVSKATAIPGVLAVFTRDNADSLPFDFAREFFSNEVMYQGEEVAFVASVDEEVLDDALEAIEVEYEELKPIVDPEESLKDGSIRLNEEGNLSGGEPKVYQRGDIEEGFRKAEITIERIFKTQAALHNSLETHGSVVAWEGDNLIVYTSTQSVFGVREGLASVLGIPADSVRVVSAYMGGGFGSKFGPGRYTIFAAAVARELGRPVRVILDRTEENLVTGNRSQTVQRIKIGAMKDGTLVAIHHRAIINVGIDGWVTDPGAPSKMLYRCPNVRTELYGVRTNLVSSTAFRAPGMVEGTFALESAIDELAYALGMDPLKLRKTNYTETDQATGLPYSSKGLRDAYEVGARLIGWKYPQNVERCGTIVRAKGVASAIWYFGGGPPAYAEVKLTRNGRLSVITSTQDIGTGTRTALAQIAAEEFGLDITDVLVSLGDTSHELYSPGSGGSGTLASIGPAVREAAYNAKLQTFEVVSQLRDVPKDDLEIRAGTIFRRKSGERVLSLRELTDILGDFSISGKGARGPNTADYFSNSFAAQFAEVEVDVDTGEVRVLRFVSVHDSGLVINPLTFSSQVEGGVIQGIGYALSEGRLVDRSSGTVINPNLNDYLVPRISDIQEIISSYVEPADPHVDNLGVKGIGEPPIIGVAPALANAIRAATGVRLHNLPFTPERVYLALKGREEEEKKWAYY